MKIPSSKIEAQSIIILKNCLNQSPYIDVSGITENDKTLSWDGHILLYRNESQRVDTLFRRIPIQVKGSVKKYFDAEQILFNIEKAHLLNYRNNGGVLYFVVYISEDFSKDKIYYATLSQLQLNRYLAKIGENKSISIICDSFPQNDSTEFTERLFNFAKDLGKTASNAPLSLKALNEGQLTEHDILSIEYTGCAYKDDPMRYFLSHPVSLNLRDIRTGCEVAVDTINILKASQFMKRPVFVEGEEIYSGYQVSRSADTERVDLLLGNGIIFSFIQQETNQMKVNFKFTIKGSLEEQIQTLKFLIVFHEKKVITIGQWTQNFPFDSQSWNSIDIKFYVEMYEFLLTVKKLLDFLGVNYVLNCDNMSEKDEKHLHFLIDSVLQGEQKELSHETEEIILHYINISNLKILVLFLRNSNGKYEIKNFFKEKFSCRFDSNNYENSFEVSQYFLLTESDFQVASNIDYNKIYNSIISLPVSSTFIEYLIIYTLKMLTGYDAQSDKDRKILETVIRLCDYMQLSCSEELKTVIRLNRFQAIKRQRIFTDTELDDLMTIINTTDRVDLKINAYLLDGDTRQADYWFQRLSLEEQEELKKDPICIFWKES